MQGWAPLHRGEHLSDGQGLACLPGMHKDAAKQESASQAGAAAGGIGMKRSEQAERIRHTEWLKRWESGIIAPDPHWAKNLMLCILIGAGFVAAVYLIGWWMR